VKIAELKVGNQPRTQIGFDESQRFNQRMAQCGNYENSLTRILFFCKLPLNQFSATLNNKAFSRNIFTRDQISRFSTL